MNLQEKIKRRELQWYKRSNLRTIEVTNKAALLTICGPSGVGKSTVIKQLSAECQTYLEKPSENPYLSRLIDGLSGFDAEANQKWFLEKIFNYIETANSASPVAVDQDPAAIVLVYSRLFYDQALITASDYLHLLEILFDLENLLDKWAPRLIFVLDAPATTLQKRVLERGNSKKAPTKLWFGNVRNYFHDFASNLSNAVLVSTTRIPPKNIVALAHQAIADPGIFSAKLRDLHR